MEHKPNQLDTNIKQPTTRRSFLNKIWIGLGLVAVLEFIGVGAAFLKPRKQSASEGDFGGIIIAGAVDDFKPNTVSALRQGKFYLARITDGGFLALSRKCTHLGCTVPWVAEENLFKCPCHASSFDITGEVINPPATRALDYHPIKIENNIISVDTSKVMKRQRFVKSQVTYTS